MNEEKENYCCVVIRIWYVHGLCTECCRKDMNQAIMYINTLKNLDGIEDITMYNFRCTKDFYNNIPDMK